MTVILLEGYENFPMPALFAELLDLLGNLLVIRKEDHFMLIMKGFAKM